MFATLSKRMNVCIKTLHNNPESECTFLKINEIDTEHRSELANDRPRASKDGHHRLQPYVWALNEIINLSVPITIVFPLYALVTFALHGLCEWVYIHTHSHTRTRTRTRTHTHIYIYIR